LLYHNFDGYRNGDVKRFGGSGGMVVSAGCFPR